MEIQSIIISDIISLDINLSGDLIALLTIKEQKYEILIYHYIEEDKKFREKYKFFPIIEKNQIINEIQWGNEEFSLPLAYKTDRTIYIYEESENKMEFQSKIEIELEKIISFKFAPYNFGNSIAFITDFGNFFLYESNGIISSTKWSLNIKENLDIHDIKSFDFCKNSPLICFSKQKDEILIYSYQYFSLKFLFTLKSLLKNLIIDISWAENNSNVNDRIVVWNDDEINFIEFFIENDSENIVKNEIIRDKTNKVLCTSNGNILIGVGKKMEIKVWKKNKNEWECIYQMEQERENNLMELEETKSRNIRNIFNFKK